MDLKTVIYNKADGIAWAQLNRPDKLNALNTQVFLDIGKVVDDVSKDDDVRVLVITGGDKVFAAGADIEQMSTGNIADSFKFTDELIPITERLADLGKPTIAMMSGYALGGGLEVALCCDFRIAADNLVVGLPEITLGIIPGGGGTQRLPRLINYSVAAEMIMTGAMVKADRAKEIGIVNRVVAADTLKDEVVKFAKLLMSRPPIALRAAKTALRKGLNVSLKDGICIEQDLFGMLFGTADQKEGMAAFLEKRKANFTGK
jgi:enoyl-CoA hydratase